MMNSFTLATDAACYFISVVHSTPVMFSQVEVLQFQKRRAPSVGFLEPTVDCHTGYYWTADIFNAIPREKISGGTMSYRSTTKMSVTQQSFSGWSSYHRNNNDSIVVFVFILLPRGHGTCFIKIEAISWPFELHHYAITPAAHGTT